MNLRQHASQTKINMEEVVKDENITRLTPNIIKYLEYLIPMKIGPTPFGRMGWDCSETRAALLKLCLNEIISAKIMNMETRRRRKKKID